MNKKSTIKIHKNAIYERGMYNIHKTQFILSRDIYIYASVKQMTR